MSDPINLIVRRTKLAATKLALRHKPVFSCPLCGYEGPFLDIKPATGFRSNAVCPACRALERHRLQILVLRSVLGRRSPKAERMLHFAPEPFFSEFFRSQFKTYQTADIAMPGVDHKVDIRSLPFQDKSYDFVFASHVLEHITSDIDAIREIRRILAPGGMAIMPVPLVCEATIEYSEPNPLEEMHVRAPGPDYYDRLTPFFGRVDLFRSGDFDQKYQLFINEDRTAYPSESCPGRTPMPGDRHEDIVPVCYA